MNPGAWSIQNRTITLVLTVALIALGLQSYHNLSRLEDPEFTIKTAVVTTPYPGATARQVELEVTDKIEQAAQQLGQIKRIRSRSHPGLSIVKVDIQDRYGPADLPQVWDELRRKIGDVQRQLPPGAGPSLVNDDFGDVFGTFITLRGDGFSQREIREYAKFLRRELLLCQDVKKISLFGVQDEVVYVEISREKMARLGVAPADIYAALKEKNTITEAGTLTAGNEIIRLHPTGGFQRVEQFNDLLIKASGPDGRLITLRDVAEVRRDAVDPPTTLLRQDGARCIGFGISTVSGGNVVKMGEAVKARMKELEPTIPVGVEFGIINLQSRDVTTAINAFVANLVGAVLIVIVVLLLFMGLRCGLIIGFILFLTIAGSFIFMDLMDVTLQRISLGALIIALGMLVDNAIVIVEGMLIRIQKGEDRLAAARAVVGQTAGPLLGATAVAIFAFGPIGLSPDNTGEYCRSLFQVLLISLGLSWFTAVSTTPLLCHMFLPGPDRPTRQPGAWQRRLEALKTRAASLLPPTLRKSTPPARHPAQSYSGPFYDRYRQLLRWCLLHRRPTLAAAAALFAAALVSFSFIDKAFFPPSVTPRFMVDFWLPAGTHIEETERAVARIENYLAQRAEVAQVTSSVGAGMLRFILTYSAESADSSYGFLIVNLRDARHLEAVRQETGTWIEEQFPDAIVNAKNFLLGPNEGGRVQVRFSGPDYDEVRKLAAQAAAILQDDPAAKAVRIEAREKVKVIQPVLSEQQARQAGIDLAAVNRALRNAYEGLPIGVFRDGDELLAIKARAPQNQRLDPAHLPDVPVWSPTAQTSIPLRQVVSSIQTVSQDWSIERRNRIPILTVHADPRTGSASELLRRIMPEIEAIPMPSPDYSLAWGGEYEDSGNAQKGLVASLPLFLGLMVFITICLFNTLRHPFIIWLTVPLSLIGVAFGLLLSGQPFGFMSLLGTLSLSGMVIKNGIVLLDEINLQIRQGPDPFTAVIEATVSRVRPVSMAALTTVLGMIPLLADAFFVAMAVAIVCGLAFATLLTLFLVPVLYASVFHIPSPTSASNTIPPPPA